MLPSLEQYDESVLQDKVWQRGILSLHDRCLATLAVAITLNQPLLLAQQVAFALKQTHLMNRLSNCCSMPIILI